MEKKISLCIRNDYHLWTVCGIRLFFAFEKYHAIEAFFTPKYESLPIHHCDSWSIKLISLHVVSKSGCFWIRGVYLTCILKVTI